MKLIIPPIMSVLILLVGCVTRTPTLSISTPPQINDDQEFGGLADGISATRKYLSTSPSKGMQFGSYTITRGSYSEALGKLEDTLRTNASPQQVANYIQENFIFLRSPGMEGTGTVLLTGYFEPIIRGSRHQSARFSQPLYKRPPDLLDLPLAQFSARFEGESPLKARLQGTSVLPYYTREEIDGPQRPLAGKTLEILWTDPIDAFFLQIQGSGTVLLDSGTEVYVNYAEKNGHRYEAIGKFLKERIAPASVTLQSIVAYLRGVSPQERDAILFKNPSYIFFKESSQRAVTATNIPAVPKRSVATDPAIFPKGALGMLRFTQSRQPGRKVSRFVLDHDTGGAIKGFGRVDLFCGRGLEAQEIAGPLQDKGAEFYVLLPKS